MATRKKVSTGLKACWTVRAGLIPGVTMSEYSSDWNYTSLDYENDGNKKGETYNGTVKAVHEYASSLEAGGLNWVAVEYLWM